MRSATAAICRCVIYEKGRPEHAAYVGNRMEGGEHAATSRSGRRPSMPTAWGTLDAAALAAEHLKKIGQARARIGIEPAFLPSDAYALLASGCRARSFVDATGVLERMRAIKTPAELDEAAAGVGADHRFDAGDDRLGARGHDQGRDHRAAAARGDQSRAAFRILPADARAPATTARRRRRPGSRARCCRSIPAATITAISATSAAWACSASRTPSSRTCWPRSRRCSRRPSRRCGPGRSAAT